MKAKASKASAQQTEQRDPLRATSPHSTPGAAEGDRETVEESLRQHDNRDKQAAKKSGAETRKKARR